MQEQQLIIVYSSRDVIMWSIHEIIFALWNSIILVYQANIIQQIAKPSLAWTPWHASHTDLRLKQLSQGIWDSPLNVQCSSVGKNIDQIFSIVTLLLLVPKWGLSKGVSFVITQHSILSWLWLKSFWQYVRRGSMFVALLFFLSS